MGNTDTTIARYRLDSARDAWGEVLETPFIKSLFVFFLLTCCLVSRALAEPDSAKDDGVESQAQAEERSPWLWVPIVSSNPKVGTSAGGLASYLFKLDSKSTSSMAGVGGTYSTTDSYMVSAFLRSYWDHDQKRLVVFGGTGAINNDYEDFLGSGQQVQTTDDLRVLFARYLQQVKGNWFAGLQATYTNYLIYAEDGNVNDILATLGLTGFDSVAVGLVGLLDTRDNQNTPTSGVRFIVHNFAYREGLGGEEDFDVYNLQFSHYLAQENGNVLAYRIEGRWTSDASPGGYSSVNLRGYTRGQYLEPNATLAEVEQRMAITKRWGWHGFAGVACLYGDGAKCSDSENVYPSIGLGGQYLLNQAEQMSLSFDVALGKSGNNGFYMRFGQAF